MIGPDSEQAGTIRHGTAAISAVLQSRVPWASASAEGFGVAAQAHFGPTAMCCSAEGCQRGAVCRRRGVAFAFARLRRPKIQRRGKRKLEDMLAASQSPFPRAEGLSVHEIIDWRETRPKLISWLRLSPWRYADSIACLI